MADDAQFQINLVTPERILLTGSATEVMLRTGEGDATFLAGHTPLVGSVLPGVVRVVRPGGDVVRVAVHGGFTQVELHVPVDPDDPDSPTTSRVTVLVGVAELAEEIDADRARVALEAAEARVAELGGTGRTPAEGEEADPELVEAEAAVTRAQVRLEAVEAAGAAA
ncbi:MAG TPA: ATP synthase delta/epsilon chain alpha-helix domain-containing protein [Acidimicrobiales bacterium]|nr:ATP synthase delta/epsilon chain alpha-helix domain-containing protein [Acidimicrobiales bacterium]